MSRWRHRFWARALFSPSTHAIPNGKREARVPTGAGVVQLWGEASHAAPGVEETAPELVVLRLLGARGRAEQATQDPANRLAVRSITWTLNPPRFGKSSAPLSTEHYLEGVLTAFDFLRACYPDARIWVYGKSIGATGAMYLAANRMPSALVVKNIIDVPEVICARLDRWLPAWIATRVNASVPDEFNASRGAAAARSPALFVVSDEDELAPAHLQENVFRAYGASAHLLRVRGQHDERALHVDDERRYAAALHRLWESTKPPCVPQEEATASGSGRSRAR